MPGIENYVEQIRRATYGRDVREAIASGIEECYSDVTQAKTIADDSIAAAEAKAQEAASSAAAAATASQDATTAKDTAVQKAGEASQSATAAAQSVSEVSAVRDSIPADYTELSNSVVDLKSALNIYCDTNIFQSATFQQGHYVSVATLSTTTINDSNIRICAQVELADTLPFNILIKILNNSYNYECGLFDENGNSLSYKSGWQTADWNYTASRKIKYIRINIRKSNDATITAYNNEIGGFLDSFVSLADSYKTSVQIDGIKDLINFSENITWNQLASEFTRASGSLGSVTYTRSEDKKQATFNGTPTGTDFYQIINTGLGTSVVGHKYAIFTPRISGSASGFWFFYLNNRSGARDTGNGAIWTADSAINIVVGIEWSRSYSLPTFNNLTVNLPIITDLTACYGAGNEPTIEEFRAMFPNDSYPKNTGTVRELTRCEKNALDIYHNTFAVAKTQSSVKIKILSFNCGHYNYGSGSEGEWTGDTLTEKINEWKAMLIKYKPDILFGQEMSNYFDAAQTVNAIDTIFRPLLPNYYFYSWTRLLSKYSFIQTWQEDVTVTVDGTTYERSLGTAKININGVDIIICSVHLPAGYTATDTAVREAMRDKLIAAFANYPYVILAGDYNESTDLFYTPFETAGYSLGNHGYFGTIATLPNESVDNIIVKGFTFYDAVSDSADACTSDHYPFASEIHIV